MITQQEKPPTAKTIRLIHTALVTGVLLFGLVAHFVIRPAAATSGAVTAVVARGLLGLSLAAMVVALMLRRRVPQRQTNESADLFWATAATPAMMMWAVLEAASFVGVFVYSQTGSVPAIGVAAVALLIFALMNPTRLERRPDWHND